mgnify:FL=1
MHKHKKIIRYLYINGIGGSHGSWFNNFIMWWWQINGKKLELLTVDWFVNQSVDDLVGAVLKKIDQLYKESDNVVLIGSSAGGSLAVNAFCADSRSQTQVVVSRGRLKRGAYPSNDKRSLARWSKTSQTFCESVLRAEHNVTLLSPAQKERMFIMIPLTDNVVPIETMLVDGVTTYKSFAFGHFGGHMAHMLTNIWRIDRFARKS